MSSFTAKSADEVTFESLKAFKSGRWDLGWKLYSYRERLFFGETGRSALGLPIWRGQPLKGKTLVLTFEQALGEQILFASMLPDLIAQGAKLTVEVDKRLIPLFSRSFPSVNFVPWQYPWHPDVYKGDYYTFMGNPGGRLRVTKEQFPTQVDI